MLMRRRMRGGGRGCRCFIPTDHERNIMSGSGGQIPPGPGDAGDTPPGQNNKMDRNCKETKLDNKKKSVRKTPEEETKLPPRPKVTE
ncbi:unnamed protein product, partial [Pleuronectes platessa]